ncbi:hypothetical protein O3M35_001862 [Rhynocoris fuscipes]
MLASGPITLLSWMIALTTRSVTALYIVRLIQGIALAVPFTVTPIYLVEIAEPKLRGQICSYFQVFWYIGTLFSYSTGPYLSYQTYLWVSCSQSILFIICYSFVPESPYYLLMINNDQKAYKALSWLRCDDNVEKEFYEIKQSVNEDMKNRGSWKDLFATRKDRIAFIIVQIVCLVRYMNGLSAIVIYATQTFSQSSGTNLTSDEMSIVIAIVLIITTFCSSFIADCIGRRPLLIFSTIGATIFTAIVSIYYYIDGQTAIDVSSYMWIAYVSLMTFMVINNIGLGPLMFSIQAEYFPSHTRAKGGGITGITAALASFLSIKQYQAVEDYFGVYMNYAIFAAISLAGAIIFSIALRETAGKSLGQIQKSFKENVDEDSGNV